MSIESCHALVLNADFRPLSYFPLSLWPWQDSVKAVFLGRHDTPAFLAENTDAVISHQLENPLNYFYLEVCWQGYPLVHNAHLVPELGYYYAGNDVQAGAARLREDRRRPGVRSGASSVVARGRDERVCRLPAFVRRNRAAGAVRSADAPLCRDGQGHDARSRRP